MLARLRKRKYKAVRKNQDWGGNKTKIPSTQICTPGAWEAGRLFLLRAQSLIVGMPLGYHDDTPWMWWDWGSGEIDSF